MVSTSSVFLPNDSFSLCFQNFCSFIPQMLRREKVSKSCDVYSYGVLVFEIATQEVPFPDVLPIVAAVMTMDGKVGEMYQSFLRKCLTLFWY